MKSVDTLINARWIIPVEPVGVLLEHHSLVIDTGRIVDLLPTDRARQQYDARTFHELNRHALIPGFVNAHTHAAMNLLKGFADDLPLKEWLQERVWPAEARWVTDRFVHDGTRLAIAEMLRSGTTCFNDMYFYPDEAARAASEAGIRAVVGLIAVDFPTVWASDADEYLSKGIEVHDDFRDDPLVTTAFAPHAPYTVSDDVLTRIQTLAEELDVPIHMHVHETADEIALHADKHGARPLSRLARLGLLSQRLLAVHMTQIEALECEQLAESGAHVIHCPESNLKLASGFCPVDMLTRSGVNVAIGTDGAASNNDLDMLGEMRTSALLGKCVAGSPKAVPAGTALRMATLNGARALGLDGVTGSLVPEKAADVAAVCLDEVETQPSYDPVSQIVYAAGRHQVSHVWVAGKLLLNERVLTTLEESRLIEVAERWRTRIAG